MKSVIEDCFPVEILFPVFQDGKLFLIFNFWFLTCQAELRHGEILGQLLYAARIVAEKEGILDGFRVVINNGPSACEFS